ncbi:MAG TPA: SMR family transporter [Edaphobacter sp.]|nr:SMR family transporter [Edaphobacter sp.]
MLHGFSGLWTAIMIAISMGLPEVATRYMPLGTAYAVRTGIGAVGTVVLGIFLFGSRLLSRG